MDTSRLIGRRPTLDDVGFTLLDNAASRHVLEKCGMSYEREFVHFDLPHVLLRVRPAGFVNAEPVG